MKLMFARLITLLTGLLCFQVFAAAPYNDENWIKCGTLLVKHVQSPLIHQLAWDKLPGYLERIDTGTLLVQLNPGILNSSMPDLVALSEPFDDVEIPESLKMVHGTSLIMVAHGSSDGIAELYRRVANSSAAAGASFRFLDFTDAKFGPNFPSVVIKMNESLRATLPKVESEILRHIEDQISFAVYLVRRDQLVFFFPHRAFLPRINSDFWAAEKIRTNRSPTVPERWTKWLMSKQDFFARRTAMLVGNWAVLSPAAYAKLLEFDRMKDESRPTVADVDESLRLALRNCFNITCVVPPAQ
jgi:hypothetical protein